MNSLNERIQRLLSEHIDLTSYNPEWNKKFEDEKNHLLNCFPNQIIRRIEHFGSTAIPQMTAKPIIDMLVEVTSLEKTKEIVVPILEKQGYEYFWRPSFGDDIQPFYAWFIKRDSKGNRTHHIHMIEKNFELWNRLLFRDYLIANPQIADEYQSLKLNLAQQFYNDRIAYTKGKTEFIERITKLAIEFYHNA